MVKSNFNRNAFIKVCVISIFGIGGLLFLYFFPAGENDFYPICLTHEWFGLYCPGCGTGRALSCLVHADLIGAFKFNPLLICALPFAGYWYCCCIAECFGKKMPWLKLSVFLVLVIMAVVIIYGILRNIPLWPFELLAPN